MVCCGQRMKAGRVEYTWAMGRSLLWDIGLEPSQCWLMLTETALQAPSLMAFAKFLMFLCGGLNDKYLPKSWTFEYLVLSW